MMDLAQMQLDFYRAQSDPALAQRLLGQHGCGLSAYANNCLFNRADVLAETFRTVRQLLGDEFFGGMARQYARQAPSLSGDLHRYGVDFAEFVAAFSPAADFPYLADICRLDWLVHLAYFAADSQQLDLAQLALIEPRLHEQLRFGLAPAVALQQSAWPVVTLWRAHWAGEAFPRPLDVAECALVWRDPQLKVQVRDLAAGEFAFIQALQHGDRLAGALEAAFVAQHDFLLGPTLQRLLADQVIVQLSI